MSDSEAQKPEYNPQICALIHKNIDSKLISAEKAVADLKRDHNEQFTEYKKEQANIFGKLDSKVNALIMMLITILLATLSLVLRSHFVAFLKLLEG